MNLETTWTIKQMTEEDVAAVAALEAENFSRPWSFDAFLKTLSDENYIVIVAKDADALLGYCVLLCTGEEADITNVAVRPPYRRRGIGFQLVTAMLGLMKMGGVRSVLLEVRESNLPAQKCYERAGFTVVGRRKNYYELPKEDALLMGRELV